MLFAFKKKYKPLIISGRKTQTVRVWRFRKGSNKRGYPAWLREGSVVKSPGLGRLRIEEVVELRLNELTREDAHLDGFKSKAEMLAAIRKIYKLKQTDNPKCYRIRFNYLGEAKDAPGAQEAARTRLRKQKSPQAPPGRSRTPRRKPPEAPSKLKEGKAQRPSKRRRQERLFPPF